jgi:hypothetical protein
VWRWSSVVLGNVSFEWKTNKVYDSNVTRLNFMNDEAHAVWWLFFQIVPGGTNSKEITKSGKGRASFPFVRIWKGVRIRFLGLLLQNEKKARWRNYRKLAAELFIWYYYNDTEKATDLQYFSRRIYRGATTGCFNCTEKIYDIQRSMEYIQC